VASQSCATCRFWVQLPRDSEPACHRHPPVRAVLDGPYLGKVAASEVAAGLTQVVFRSLIYPDTWCGEWDRRQ
jgi:hypothetical protein